MRGFTLFNHDLFCWIFAVNRTMQTFSTPQPPPCEAALGDTKLSSFSKKLNLSYKNGGK